MRGFGGSVLSDSDDGNLPPVIGLFAVSRAAEREKALRVFIGAKLQIIDLRDAGIGKAQAHEACQIEKEMRLSFAGDEVARIPPVLF